MTRDLAAAHQRELEAFGAVVIVNEELRISHVSANAQDILGIAPAALIDAPLSAVFDATQAADLQAALSTGVRDVGWRQISLASTGEIVKLHAFDPGGSLCGLDVLPLPSQLPGTEAQALERVAGWSERLYSCDSSGELLDVATVVARQITGFAGAWLTKTEAAGHSLVVAADVEAGGERAIGQLIPVQDLPPDHPRLGDRLIPFFVADLDAGPTHLTPDPHELDLQGSSLLRPFPGYLAERSKIGVKALASVPLVFDGRLWGRLSAAHPSARRLTAATQAELRLIGALIGTRLAELVAAENARDQVELARWAARVVRAAAGSSDLAAGLVRDGDALCGVCNADAAIVVIDGRTHAVGAPLRQSAQEQVVAVARAAIVAVDDPLVAATTFEEKVDPAVAAGYLAIRLSSSPGDLVVWTRGERRRPITWIERGAEEDAVDQPGALFKRLAERVEHQTGSSSPWRDAELQAVRDLREAIGELVVARYAQMQTLNSELRRSNEEYDAFAHAAAHDLGAPLRGIRLHAEFLLEELRESLSEEQAQEFETVLRLSDRMHQLLADLLAYAEVGNQGWHPRVVSIDDAVREAVELLGPDALEATIRATPETLTTDPAGLRHVLVNLIGNAIKYSDGPADVSVGLSSLGEAAKRSELPARLQGAPLESQVLTVTDRGIGIDPAHHERVFGLFQQLNPKAPGSGSGLALCRLICRRHGGDVWLESEPGRGCTFFVATGLDAAPPTASPEPVR